MGFLPQLTQPVVFHATYDRVSSPPIRAFTDSGCAATSSSTADVRLRGHRTADLPV